MDKVTYIAEIRKDLPNPFFIQFGETLSILPQKVRKVTQLAQLGLDEQRLIFLPTINVTKYVRVASQSCRMGLRASLDLSPIPLSAGDLRKMLKDLDFLSKSKSK